MPAITRIILEVIIHTGSERLGQLGSAASQAARCQLWWGRGGIEGALQVCFMTWK